MEARFAQLKALVTSMAAQMKSIASRLGKVKYRKNGQSYGSNVDPRLFCGTNFLGLMALKAMMSHMLRGHESWVVDFGNHIMVPNPSEMILIICTNDNAQMPK
jgi:hypothetical protein